MTTPVCSVILCRPKSAFWLLTRRTQDRNKMSLVQLFVPTEVAHDAVAELGELGDVQFKDVSYIY